MVAKMRFWLSERSMSITKASVSVMILKSVLRYSLLITNHVLRGRQFHLWYQLNNNFYCTIALNFEIYFLGKERLV